MLSVAVVFVVLLLVVVVIVLDCLDGGLTPSPNSDGGPRHCIACRDSYACSLLALAQNFPKDTIPHSPQHTLHQDWGTHHLLAQLCVVVAGLYAAIADELTVQTSSLSVFSVFAASRIPAGSTLSFEPQLLRFLHPPLDEHLPSGRSAVHPYNAHKQ